MLSPNAISSMDQCAGEDVAVAHGEEGLRVRGINRNLQAEDAAVHCPDCQMWLNGLTQWRDHCTGKKHRKNVYRMNAAASGL